MPVAEVRGRGVGEPLDVRAVRHDLERPADPGGRERRRPRRDRDPDVDPAGEAPEQRRGEVESRDRSAPEWNVATTGAARRERGPHRRARRERLVHVDDVGRERAELGAHARRTDHGRGAIGAFDPL